MASAVSRVILRCEEAVEKKQLDLSECQLMQVPDAVYHLMRNTELKSCDLSGNDITKITPKFALKFSLITDLNLSHNQISKLPDEIVDLKNLINLDISYNTFISLPNAIFKIPNLQNLKAGHNHIIEVEVDDIKEAPSLQILDITNNPIAPKCHDCLSSISTINVLLTPKEKEDWEDLTI
ncbi:PREDICTED: leucine-rich repeat-containing protein 20 isoform X2 [Nicrophorus vespilloides]|uniref:Leucine-rich repeat-containing protein 20 isoform X2 n=1 Tax=Nicrophorus vespilloides TaxID=110193 RepID=A0ABM1NCJ8_NICVS|nr:PREDICTED: leucine-rich repeat-containing protein 20 isoform X2 [Nicrophorus vespilloides]